MQPTGRQRFPLLQQLGTEPTFLREQYSDAELLLIGGNIAEDISPYHKEFIAQAQQLGVHSVVQQGPSAQRHGANYTYRKKC